MKLVLIGGYPKGFKEPFHIKTRSGKILRKITDDLGIKPEFFDLWKNKKEEDSRNISGKTISALKKFIAGGYKLVALGRYIEEAIAKNNLAYEYLPHPASRDKKFILRLEKGLRKYK